MLPKPFVNRGALASTRCLLAGCGPKELEQKHAWAPTASSEQGWGHHGFVAASHGYWVAR